MSFFEPVPEPPTEPRRAWSPPLWDRPSEGIVPAIVPIGELVHQDDDIAIALQDLRVYPNGFTINIFSLARPDSQQPGGVGTLMMGHGQGGDPAQRFPRLGVRFADGREGGRDIGDVAKDSAGVPTSPIVAPTGGGGGSNGFRFGFWVFPLPPDGPLDIFMSFPRVGLEEAQVTVEGALIRSASKRARVIWS